MLNNMHKIIIHYIQMYLLHINSLSFLNCRCQKCCIVDNASADQRKIKHFFQNSTLALVEDMKSRSLGITWPARNLVPSCTLHLYI